jgi:hypothetical protein
LIRQQKGTGRSGQLERLSIIWCEGESEYNRIIAQQVYAAPGRAIAAVVPEPHYVEPSRGGPLILAAVSITLFFSLADAVLSVDLASVGLMRLNPVMDVYLKLLGPSGYILLRHGITSTSALFLVWHQEKAYFRGRVRGKYLLLVLPFLYGYSFLSKVLDALP